MSIPNKNLPNIQLSSDNTSLKLVIQGSATISVVAKVGGNFGSGLATIPHNAGTDNLIWQVAMFSNSLSSGNNVPTPFESNDDGQLLHSYVNSTNLYVEVAQQSNTGSITPFTVTFYYRVMLP